MNLGRTEFETLENLGIYINYNSYGECISDLHIAPDRLYLEMAAYESPYDFIGDNHATFELLEQGYQEDMINAQGISPEYQSDSVAVYILPDVIWARRVNGVFSNFLAYLEPNRAHAVITYTKENDYQLSVRVPLCNKIGADELCLAFPTGGGRKAAAGINHLPIDQLESFIRKFELFYERGDARNGI